MVVNEYSSGGGGRRPRPPVYIPQLGAHPHLDSDVLFPARPPVRSPWNSKKPPPAARERSVAGRAPGILLYEGPFGDRHAGALVPSVLRADAYTSGRPRRIDLYAP